MLIFPTSQPVFAAGAKIERRIAAPEFVFVFGEDPDATPARHLRKGVPFAAWCRFERRFWQRRVEQVQTPHRGDIDPLPIRAKLDNPFSREAIPEEPFVVADLVDADGFDLFAALTVTQLHPVRSQQGDQIGIGQLAIKHECEPVLEDFRRFGVTKDLAIAGQ